MDERLRKIQDSYIAELRAAIPDVKKWWKAQLKKNEEKSYPGGLTVDFATRWPTELGAHPRLIAIFRKYFLLAEELNLELEEQGRKYVEDEPGELWGRDVPPPTREQVIPIDLLVNDLEDENDDLYEVMETMFFIPIGVGKDGDPC
ncbi:MULTISPECIES: hypothetical protein [unclassified Mesorhizobium]|uniref:hypothetical protein n=1 Tax=unclassified Mesorhizobium TaxID=325217 RepID=UPI000F74DDEB|nr:MULTISPECIES: hypothetical protein [unclassified Mesorhizobium]AZO16728.1 hypothetical protein EJ069_19625 [Mesorhizobium sp. M2A.F.Ca.ET.043.05.1.1]RWE76414.1 MAG: hypothetical protein EOS42_11305 [Mesorhizobium sp.]TIV31665.1 MAG: hypothetical protein E5V90_06325 [Mesorhizobium sp.]